VFFPAKRGMRGRCSPIVRAAAFLLMTTLLAGCGSAVKGARAGVGIAAIDDSTLGTTPDCPATVANTLQNVLGRVYHEGVFSERTASAQYMITHSVTLREAVEAGDEARAQAAVKALLKTGHMTDVRVTRGARTLVEEGGPALTPLKGTLTGANGETIATYLASVWADKGFRVEADGITQGIVVLRAGAHSIGGSPELTGTLGKEGTTVYKKVLYQYVSRPAKTYPSGTARIYLLIPISSTKALCGKTEVDTTVNTLKGVAELIYRGELGEAAHKQLARVQHNKPLLQAVAERNPAATELAIKALLNEHIVRMHVTVEGNLLSDVGGPYVLAPVSANLTREGHTIGTVTLSVQDDEGYLRLARRLAGMDVLMYMKGDDPELVKNSLGPVSGTVPAGGSYTYHGHSYRVFTVHAEAFPAGTLAIRVLVPIPYP
jgi:hypothetical protein